MRESIHAYQRVLGDAGVHKLEKGQVKECIVSLFLGSTRRAFLHTN